MTGTFYGIATFSSGAPSEVSFTQSTATNITGSPSVSARINVNGNPYHLGSGYGPLQAFNPTVFALPAVGTLGDPSRNLMRGPGIENWNISLVKGIPIWERVHLQFRVEMYNAFNHTQFSTERFVGAVQRGRGQDQCAVRAVYGGAESAHHAVGGADAVLIGNSAAAKPPGRVQRTMTCPTVIGGEHLRYSAGRVWSL